MHWVGIEPTTSWMDERGRRKIKEKIKCGEWVLNPQPPCLKTKKERRTRTKYFGVDGNLTRVSQIWKMQLSSLKKY